MAASKFFIDTNVILYLFSADAAKADRAEQIIGNGGIINIQVLNELAAVTQRKLRMSWTETNEILSVTQSLLSVEPLVIETHELGCEIAQRYQLSVYDAMIVAAALLANCSILYSEDMQHGLIVNKRLTVQNPFTIK
jgi:predicted nucleic acid-binding protein